MPIHLHTKRSESQLIQDKGMFAQLQNAPKGAFKKSLLMYSQMQELHPMS